MFSLSSSKKSDEVDGDDVWFVSEVSSSRKLLTSVLLSTSQKFCGENLDGNIHQSKGYSPFPYTSCSHYITLGEIPYIHLHVMIVNSYYEEEQSFELYNELWKEK
jgi:hypothetical protein